MISDDEKKALLEERLILKKDISDVFIQSMQIRFDLGIKMMRLAESDIFCVFCSSINKHTCVESIDGYKKKYLILDEHHMDLLGALNIVFFMYGRDDFTSPIFRLLNERLDIPKKRLRKVVAILISEQNVLQGNITRATALLDEFSNISLDFSDDEKGRANLDWYILKSNRAMTMQALVMNFYVFHELAHIKNYSEDESIPFYYELYYDYFRKRMSGADFEDYLERLPVEDVICDAYALDLLFDYMYEKGHEYYIPDMVESYVCSVLNLTLMDSVIGHGEEITTWEVICWFRIIASINVVGYAKEISGHKGFIKEILDSLNYTRMCYMNYLIEVRMQEDSLVNIIKNIPENTNEFSTEWKKEYENYIHRFLKEVEEV